MIEIVPNWHPVWVHFAIALSITAAGIYLLFGWKSGRADAAPPAALILSRWLLWLGVLAALAALLTGFWASDNVQHDELGHANMLVHRNWAIASAVLFGTAAVLEWLRRSRAGASVISAMLLLAGGFAIAKTGLEGAENVFEHGLGVQRLPQDSAAGHEHGGHEQADEAQSTEAPGDHDHSGQQQEHASGEHESAGGRDSAADDPTHPAARMASRLNRALADGDADAVRLLMAEDVQIFESGNVEASLDEYSGHHLPSDMAFMAAMSSEVISRRVIDDGGMATVLTRYRLRGHYRNQDIETVTTETLVMRKGDGGWQIVHVHWSSD